MKNENENYMYKLFLNQFIKYYLALSHLFAQNTPDYILVSKIYHFLLTIEKWDFHLDFYTILI